MKTLYISDLDGTLLNAAAEINDYTKDTLRGLIEQGVCFSIATARSAATVQTILEGIPFKLPIILMNGALIYDIASKEYVNTSLMPYDAVAEALSIIRRHKLPAILYRLQGNEMQNLTEEITSPEIEAFKQERIERYNKTFITVDRLDTAIGSSTIGTSTIGTGVTDTGVKPLYLTLLSTKEKLLPAYEELKKLAYLSIIMYEDTYSRGLWFLEVFSVKASKSNAAIYLKEAYGFDRLIGFGDNLNDLPLFSVCDECYAVANALQEVKEAATGIIDSNLENGVVRWLIKAIAQY